MGYYNKFMSNDIKKRAEHRVKIISGQMKGLQKMIETDEYCIDILTQSLAIQKSLASLNKLILKNHMATHVVDMVRSKNKKTRAKAIDELMSLYELNNIRGR